MADYPLNLLGSHRIEAMDAQGASSGGRVIGRRAFWLTVAALAWALGLFVVGAATLTNDNGVRILAPLAVPAVLTVLAWIALHHQGAHHSRAARRAAWIAIGLLVLFSLLTGFSIGLFVLPTAVLLIAAAALTPLHGQ